MAVAGCLPYDAGADNRIRFKDKSEDWIVSSGGSFGLSLRRLLPPGAAGSYLMVTIYPNAARHGPSAQRIDDILYPYPILICARVGRAFSMRGATLDTPNTALVSDGRTIAGKLIDTRFNEDARNSWSESCWFLEFDIDFRQRQDFSYDLAWYAQTPQGQSIAPPTVQISFQAHRLGLCGPGCFASH